MDKCPCVDCICIPICRHRHLNAFLGSCELVREYLMRYVSSLSPSIRRTKCRQKTIAILKPTQWGVDHNGYFTRYEPNKKEFIHYG